MGKKFPGCERFEAKMTNANEEFCHISGITGYNDKES